MKKTFALLLFSIVLAGSAFAQFNDRQRHDRDDYGYNKDHDKFGGKFYFFTARERDMQIAQINRDYSDRIQSVRRRFFMNRMAKERQIMILNQQREYAISAVWAKYNDRRNKGDGRDRRNW